MTPVVFLFTLSSTSAGFRLLGCGQVAVGIMRINHRVIWVIVLGMVGMGCSSGDDDSSEQTAVVDLESYTPDTGASNGVQVDAGNQSDGDLGGMTPNDVVLAPDTSVDGFGSDVVDSEGDLDVTVPGDVTPRGGLEPGTAILPPDWLDTLLLFGIATDPVSPLSYLSQTAAGIAPVPSRLVLTESMLEIRVAKKSGEPMEGNDGLIESYPYSLNERGEVVVDFRSPAVRISIQIYGTCQYVSVGTLSSSDALVDAGWLTWSFAETFQSKACGGGFGGGGLPSALLMTVHYLRPAKLNSTFVPRLFDENEPFGFFLETSPETDDVHLTRLPIQPGDEDGQIVYWASASVPEDIYSVLEEVLNDWNDVTEKQIGVRPFVLKPAEGDTLPWNPRHRTIHWDGSQSLGAVAPFISDPYTGEIIASEVILWLGDLPTLIEKYVKFLDKNPDAAWVDAFGNEENAMFLQKPFVRDEWAGPRAPRTLQLQSFCFRPLRGADIAEIYLRSGRTLTPEQLTREVVAQFLSHEIGHNHGLRHNFKGSMDKDNHVAEEPSTTVMDYVIGQGRPGSYDQDAIRYAYGQFEGEIPPYLYCTDESVELDPGCARWDFAHPVTSVFKTLDAIAEGIDPDASTGSLNNKAEEEDWNGVFRRARQFVNTDYEAWDPDMLTSAFVELLARVDCGPGCATHPWFRSQLALYLLYTKFVASSPQGQQGGQQWFEFPPLNETDAAILMDSYFNLIVAADEPTSLKTAIINKLPTANVPGAVDLLNKLDAYFAALESLTGAETSLWNSIKAAKAEAN